MDRSQDQLSMDGTCRAAYFVIDSLILANVTIWTPNIADIGPNIQHIISTSPNTFSASDQL